MKKLLVAAMMVLSTAAAFAGDSDALKAIKKAKTYAEAEQLVNSSLSSLASNDEKAAAYNKLYELAYKVADDQLTILMTNQTAAQLGQEAKPVDEAALYTNLSKAITAAEKCYEYDIQPNAKGKVAPKYYQKAAQTLYNLRPNLINGGGFFQSSDKDKALELLAQYCNTANSPLFSGVEKTEDTNLAQAGFFAAYMALLKQDYATAEKYADYALNDAERGKDAMSIKLDAMRHQLNNHADSVAFADKVKVLYDKDPDNQSLLATLIDSYNALGQSDKAAQVVDERLAASPNNFVALLVKGQLLENAKNYDEAGKYIQKALDNAPEQSKCFTTAELGNCYFYHAQERLEAVKGALSPAAKKQFDPFYQQAVDCYEAAKKLDADGSQKNLYAARLYNCYYFLYGEADSRTQEARTYAGY